ncbi:hypothetical protein DEU38_103161 [Rhodococcus sp. AG1013]|uniref:hypothetical protein n=1 Tax=Rhodococcus sp. AG1013 TaxID=2183996 RepID=UPI000E0BD444|nr:hypothetical protein [Rhodococcus sp. AG1013]RDI32428.1 hypothetical protein DEU38_103161 [Rhodococcus sp. AG1013]
MTDTITLSQKYRIAAEVLLSDDLSKACGGYAVEALWCQQQAARLEAESARNDLADKLERIYRSVDSPLVRDGLLAVVAELQPFAEWLIAEAVRRDRAQLAADGRLLPEGGAVLTAAEADDVRAFMRWAAGRNNGMEHPDEAAYRIRVKFGLYDSWVPAPPAVSVPDIGPDGTPEKPWETWQDVPEGVRYWGRNRLYRWVNRDGRRMFLPLGGGEVSSSRNELEMQRLAPFVRVDGDQKENNA